MFLFVSGSRRNRYIFVSRFDFIGQDRTPPHTPVPATATVAETSFRTERRPILCACNRYNSLNLLQDRTPPHTPCACNRYNSLNLHLSSLHTSSYGKETATVAETSFRTEIRPIPLCLQPLQLLKPSSGPNAAAYPCACNRYSW
ncbi:hypothetical protein AVEN_100804-1 [Araneus ventricosus]|uniref:Uncharacterized protein n=1 Tax=Araneus ventricosus TaxID=182803 RepID=A0A4Y2AVL2_ARAVE|nr:hypothetical protein AVEN_100804-1 [Araneus ventricosus]